MKRFGMSLLLCSFALLPILGASAGASSAAPRANSTGNTFVNPAQRGDGDYRERKDQDRDNRDGDRRDDHHDELRITRAVYGARGRTRDVTQQVRAQIREGRLNIPVQNDTMGGDPARNRPKTLTVWYTLNGRPAQVTVNENDFLRLPVGVAYSDRDDHSHDYDQERVERVVVPPGTQIAVRTDERIDSHEVVDGQDFRAEIAEDVRDADGNVAIPRGSEARLITRRVEGNGDITLDIQSVWVGGKRYRVSTEGTELENHRDGVGANKRTGEFAGGGAVLGAVIGAIAGGGKGAAIGAAAGAGAGAGTEIMTQGREVHVPEESVIRFRLDRPLHLHFWQ